MKRLMSGKKFFLILRYLHCCSLAEQPSKNDIGYNANYKVKELTDALETRYVKVFNPGQQLSLDETLIRAFGRIKFKVRIITKSARYGIKIYVVTDAVTSFVLRIIIYTGSDTYYFNNNVGDKKTVQVVKQLLEPYYGTNRCVYIDRFYTSIDLLKELQKNQIYVTGKFI